VTRRYEIVYIFDSTAEEAKIEEQLERFHALLKNGDNPEPIQNVNHWGKRTLAYSIGGNEIGYYVVVQFATDPTLLPEFERLVKLEESVIRYQIVLNEGEVPVPAPIPGEDGAAKDTKDGEDADEPSPAPTATATATPDATPDPDSAPASAPAGTGEGATDAES
jgi:small subunit ribosomal protein S6